MGYFSSFLRRFFGNHSEKPRAVAKTRLEKVVSRDRVDTSAQHLVDIKKDIVKVLSYYFEIDEKQADVYIKSDDAKICLVANIPVNKVKRYRKKKSGK